MTFLNWSILAGMAAIAIPIIIHLLSRRTPKHVQWAAMIFLVESLRSSSRRILLEELILMGLRCLLVATLVLAAARPFVPVSSNIPWTIVLPALLLSGFTAGACGVSWKNKKPRWAWAWTTVTLLLIAIGATMIEHFVQKSKWSSDGMKDIAIIIDASDSMKIKDPTGISSFEKAITDTRKLIEKCKGSDAVSIILAGSAPQNIIETPIPDKGELTAALESVSPIGGNMNINQAILKACSNLDRGTNPAKRIAIFTDAQKLGWDPTSSQKWNYISSAMGMLESKPKIICSTIPIDTNEYTNLAATQIQPSHPITAVNHRQIFNVRVTNTSQNQVPPATLRFEVDEFELPPRMTSSINPQQSETISFEYTFTQPGIHNITARIDNSDSLSADNVFHRVIRVMGNVKVLIIDPGPDSGAKFIELALQPLGQLAGDYLVTPTVISPSKFQSMANISQYHSIILTNVPHLPYESASRIAKYVRNGGGVMVVMGQNCKPDFYNSWTGRFDKMLMPATMNRWTVQPEKPVAPAGESFDKSVLPVLAETDNPTVNRVIVRAWWQLQLDDDDMEVSQVGAFSDNTPMLAMRRYGKGTVIGCAFSFDPLDSTFARHGEAFVPFINEVVQYLANPQSVNMNIQAAQPILFSFKTKPDASLDAPEKLPVTTPDGKTRFANISVDSQRVNISYDKTEVVGLYKINIPSQLASGLEDTFPGNTLCLNVNRDPRESDIELLTSSDFEAIAKHVEIFRASDLGQIQAAMSGNIPGREIWRMLAILAFCLIIAETVMTRLAAR